MLDYGTTSLSLQSKSPFFLSTNTVGKWPGFPIIQRKRGSVMDYLEIIDDIQADNIPGSKQSRHLKHIPRTSSAWNKRQQGGIHWCGCCFWRKCRQHEQSPHPSDFLLLIHPALTPFSLFLSTVILSYLAASCIWRQLHQLHLFPSMSSSSPPPPSSSLGSLSSPSWSSSSPPSLVVCPA